MDMPANKRRFRNERHEEEMEISDAMTTTEEDAAGVGMVVAGWEDEDDETNYMGQQELETSVDNGQWCNKRQRWTVNKQMVS